MRLIYLVWPASLLCCAKRKQQKGNTKCFMFSSSFSSSFYNCYFFWKSKCVILFKQFTSSLWPGWGSLIFISIDILMCFISLIKSEHLSFFLSFFFILLFLHLCTHLESPEGIAWHALLPSLSCSPSLFVLILCQWLLRHNRTWLAVTVSTATGLWDQIRSSAEELAAP